MKIVADAAIPGLDDTFRRHADLVRLAGRAITRPSLADADALLVRTVTRVDRELLEGTPVRFVGTATIGTDHLDTAWLKRAGITWASAPGCNADAAAQYALAMIMLACRRTGIEPTDRAVGIIGRGNVGSRLGRLLDGLGIPWVANDPPLAEQGEPGLVPLATALAQPIVSLHVPLTRTGPHPTWRLVGPGELGQLPDGGLLVNTARGEVLDGDALLRELTRGRLHAALDTWPGEPEPDPALVAAAAVATPHVAGYSREGKLRATLMVYGEFLAWRGQSRVLNMSAFGLPTAPAPRAASLAELIEVVTGVAGDDAALRGLAELEPGRRGAAFEGLRADHPGRREFSAYVVHDPALRAPAMKLGFRG